jgi:peptidyl-tRNA hydrolase, PTH1 family
VNGPADAQVTRLVVGLGNPGPEYEGTRHNVGFRVVERVAREAGLLFHPGRKLAGYTGPGAFTWARLAKPPALLACPEAWMNRSGDVVLPLVRWAGLAPEAVLVVYDDLDLPVGKLRIRPHGGAGGHNGMRSIIERLASDRFPRLRVGIGPAGTDAARHVLGRFSAKEQVEIEISVAEAAEAILDWIRSGDLEGCMTRFHSRWNQGT